MYHIKPHQLVDLLLWNSFVAIALLPEYMDDSLMCPQRCFWDLPFLFDYCISGKGPLCVFSDYCISDFASLNCWANFCHYMFISLRNYLRVKAYRFRLYCSLF